MKIKDLPLYIISGIVVLGYLFFLFMLLYHPIPEVNRDILNQAAGALLGAFITVVSFWIGSSAGSKNKTDLLNYK